jgi:hypothetical protein
MRASSAPLVYNTRMVEDPYQAPQAHNDNPREPPLVSTPLLTALLLFIVLPLLVVLVVLME